MGSKLLYYHIWNTLEFVISYKDNNEGDSNGKNKSGYIEMFWKGDKV